MTSNRSSLTPRCTRRFIALTNQKIGNRELKIENYLV
jgi:hypothetical protein